MRILSKRRDQRSKLHTVFQIWNVWWTLKRGGTEGSLQILVWWRHKKRKLFIYLCLLISFSVSIPRNRQPHQDKQTRMQSYNALLHVKFTAAILYGLEISSNLFKFPGVANSTLKNHYCTHQQKYTA